MLLVIGRKALSPTNKYVAAVLDLGLTEPLGVRIIFPGCPWSWIRKIYNFIAI